MKVRAQEPVPQSVVDGVVSAMCLKQVVLLGELPSHGEAIAFDAKARIVDQLVLRCGFNGILFEAPIYDFLALERAAASGSASMEQLENAIGRFWLTRELAPWRHSLFESVVRGQLVVAGLDDQVSITSRHAIASLPQLIADALPPATSGECRAVVSRHLGWTYSASSPFDEREQQRLRQCARSAADSAARSSDAMNRVMLESFARYADRQRSGATPGRDESMYRNLTWFLDRLPDSSRVIVWTSTVHAARQRGSLGEDPVGARAVARWGDRVGSVGFTAFAGQTSRAARPASPIPEAPPGSLEALATAGDSWAFLGADQLRAIDRVPSRLLGRFAAENWSDFFDAVVVIRQEVAPTFDPWK